MASLHAEKLLGVRDGFLRYFQSRLRRAVSVVVVPQEQEDARHGLTLSDQETLDLALERARCLRSKLGGHYHFCVSTEGGLHAVEADGKDHYFVRNWTVISSDLGEAFGGSGSVQLPDELISGLESTDVPFAVPGTRRGGGMLSSLTGGLETRRTAVGSATLHALSSLFYGVLGGQPARPRAQ